MPNTSATGGYLLPAAAPAPVEGDAFEDFIHDVIQGITGLAGSSIRPRWQPDPPNMPQASESWIAFGITEFEPDTYAVETERTDGTGSDLVRHETNTISVSCYGANASVLASQLRDGLQVSQNRAVLVSAGVGLVNTGTVRNAPALVKDRWQKRLDFEIVVRRQIMRKYPVLYLLTANGLLITDTTPQIINPIDVQQ